MCKQKDDCMCVCVMGTTYTCVCMDTCVGECVLVVYFGLFLRQINQICTALVIILEVLLEFMCFTMGI